MFGKALKEALKGWWDNISKSILLALIWSLTTPPFWFLWMFMWRFRQVLAKGVGFWNVVIIIHVLTAMTLYFPTTFAVFGVMKRMLDGEHRDMWKEFWREFKAFFWRSILLVFVNAFFWGAFAYGFSFYINVVQISILKWPLLFITFWYYYFYMLLQVHIIPVFIYNRDSKITQNYKRAWLLTVVAYGPTLLTAIMLLAVFIVLFLSIFGVFMLFITFVAAVTLSLYITVVETYQGKYTQTEQTSSEMVEKEMKSWKYLFGRREEEE